MRNKRSVCIIGAHGTPNIGDQSILIGLIHLLRSDQSTGGIKIISRNPKLIRTYVDEPEMFPGNSFFYLRTFFLVAKCDELILGGGGIIQDQTSLANLMYYVAYIMLAGLLRKKIRAIGVGVGPFRYSVSRLFVRLAFSFVSEIIVRDDSSRTRLQTIIGERTPVRVCPDPAFLLSPQGSGGQSSVMPHHGQSMRLGINLRPWLYRLGGLWPVAGRIRHQKWEPEFSACMDVLANELKKFNDVQPVTLVMMPMESFQDTLALSILLNKLSAEKIPVERPRIGTPAELLRAYQSIHAMIGMRYHSLIFSIITHRPFIALSYTDKVRSLVQGLGWAEFEVPFEAQAMKRIGPMLQALVADFPQLQERLRIYDQQCQKHLRALGHSSRDHEKQ
ncbi:MAG: polysaccharide pyruvyl transferase family protein [Patescibacteria group bacterium]